ncbi:CAP domain-containing protein [Nocardia sp. NPDC051570]|uniref:CAP domain-containing protein n=1 Tax=Nocardia sp. NPDC051570 TaxID=3364324 RepID=UPI0037BD351A
MMRFLPVTIRSLSATVGVSAFAICAIAGTPAATAAPQSQPQSGGEVDEVIKLTNSERAKAGCPALKPESHLKQAAQAHTEDMAAHGYLDHNSSKGSPFDRMTAAGYHWQKAAENIAQGYTSPSDVMKGWMSSPGHRQNILDCGLRDIGVGYAKSRNGTPYWTQDFGTSNGKGSDPGKPGDGKPGGGKPGDGKPGGGKPGGGKPGDGKPGDGDAELPDDSVDWRPGEGGAELPDDSVDWRPGEGGAELPDDSDDWRPGGGGDRFPGGRDDWRPGGGAGRPGDGGNWGDWSDWLPGGGGKGSWNPWDPWSQRSDASSGNSDSSEDPSDEESDSPKDPQDDSSNDTFDWFAVQD